MSNRVIVPAMSAVALTVESGRIIRITDEQGGQPGDFVAFKLDDLSVTCSQARTRVENGRTSITRGHTLWTNRFPPEVMFTITGDTGGPHDLLYPPCCRYAMDKRFGLSRDGCLENLARALEPWKVRPHDIPDPLNLFFLISVDGDGRMNVCKPTSAPGSLIELRAEMDCLVAVSTCPVPLHGKANSGYLIEVLDP